MGVMSRRVLPVCGNLCFFCPSLRARSRQPVKRYKKLLSDIFPRNQEPVPNDRKIGKLCEYAAKNPLRIPKITSNLEQRCFKGLRNEKFGCVKVVLCVYTKLLSTCKEQMAFFASSLLGVIQTLLEQTRLDEMLIIGCDALAEFVNSQMDSTHMFHLEGLIPKLCQLAEEDGDDDRALRLRSAGLKVLASMVWFMGEQSHISMEFDSIISVTLENYMDTKMTPVNGSKVDENGPSFPDIIENSSDFDPTMDTSKNPSYWSKVILHNIAGLAKEATTIRRVLEPVLKNFDAENHWSQENGIVFSVLKYLQLLMEETEKSQVLLAILVKHMEHKNIAKQPHIQVNIVNVITLLAENAKSLPSVATIGTITDLMKHLRRCLQNSAELSSSGGDNKYNTDLQLGLEKCISQLSNKVGEVGPILDAMAVVLENISSNSIVARSAISTAFPDALFHQLLYTMVHPDHETRVGAHDIFSAVLLPSLLSSSSDQNKGSPEAVRSDLSLSASKKLRSQSFAFQDKGKDQVEFIDERLKENGNQASDMAVRNPIMRQSPRHSYSFEHFLRDGKMELNSLRLSSHQVSLLLSTIWVQANSVENTPAIFEAMARSYSIAVLFTRVKTSGHMALARSFQLAFSLRSISLDQEGRLQPSRRRSLFTLASYMLIFSARAGNFPELVPVVKASLTDKTIDPYLKLVEDAGLQAVCVESDIKYGSKEDEDAALKSLLAIKLDDLHLKETVISHFMTKFKKLSEDELSSIKKQLLDGFSPDDAYSLGVPLSRPCSPLAQMEFQSFDEMPLAAVTDEANGSQSGRKASLSISELDVLSANELLDSMKSQCEASVMGKQQKMSILHHFKHQQEASATSEEIENEILYLPSEKAEFNNVQGHISGQIALCSQEHMQHSFRLPPSSPYDKFLKAAGSSG
ncbi:protein EFR3-like protein B isoform X2 [Gossypium australe]|uniref:Protein EFR3-like protein B isoform X2 n=1 Tax=Gossypium australe TaxID=47621 RepID=A0A5B6UER3_9ROSI|nr:protein EFR3-like protein B isoform X2 [Gossypium australe]